MSNIIDYAIVVNYNLTVATAKSKVTASKRNETTDMKPSELGTKLRVLSEKAIKSGIRTLTNHQIHRGISKAL